jgi:FtsP/CotA-like multicopper oxidase with cupredoxin domain
VDGRAGHAIAINGTIPAPLIRLREGERRAAGRHQPPGRGHVDPLAWPDRAVRDGRRARESAFPGIKPHSTFVYEFPLKQAGTYWYHSHSGLQEQLGHYGPMIIDPAGPDPIAYDREHVIVLSDWSFMHPHMIFSRLKQEGGFFNRQKLTLMDRLSGRAAPLTRGRAGHVQPDADGSDRHLGRHRAAYAS